MAKIKSLVVFATRGLAVPALEALVDSGRKPSLIVARPPRATEEEGLALTPPTVADWAADQGIEFLEPPKLQTPKVLERIEKLQPELALTIAYGRNLPSEIVEACKLGALSLHPSLLPKFRGEAPIRRALSGGAKKTGASVIRMEEEAFTGPVLDQEEVQIGPAETYGELQPRIAAAGAEVLIRALEKFEKKPKMKGKKQNEKASSRAPRIDRRHRKAPWFLEASDVYNRLRAYSPRPGLATFIRLQPVQVLGGKALDWVKAPYGTTGTFLGMRQGRLAILCGDNTVFGIEKLEFPGEEPQRAGDFARSVGLQVGDSFA